MTISLSRDRLAEISGGEVRGPAAQLTFRGVEYDSREVSGGELFVCLKGSQHHGHTFINGAFSRGAALFLVEDASLFSSFAEPERLILVEDTLKAFWKVAAAWRKEVALPLVAVTGSVGKTTTKEIIAALLLRESRGTYSLKSHNNHVGVPYTMCRIARDYRWAILEMGMNHAGELAALSRLAAPDVAVITAVAPAHIEAFASLRAIADAKFEILEGLAPGKTVILNGDDAELQSGAAKRELHKTYKVLNFGARADCDARVSGVTLRGLDGISFELALGKEQGTVNMGVLGGHNAANAACAALAVRSLNPQFTLAKISAGLQDFRAPLMRLNVKTLRGGKKIIDDSYNANPASMRACIELADGLQRSGLKVGLVLGDMNELGAEAGRYHTEIGSLVGQARPEFLVAVGNLAVSYVEPARSAGVSVFHTDSPEAAGHIVGKMGFDIVMVKASRAVALDRTVATLIKSLGE